MEQYQNYWLPLLLTTADKLLTTADKLLTTANKLDTRINPDIASFFPVKKLI